MCVSIVTRETKEGKVCCMNEKYIIERESVSVVFYVFLLCSKHNKKEKSNDQSGVLGVFHEKEE